MRHVAFALAAVLAAAPAYAQTTIDFDSLATGPVSGTLTFGSFQLTGISSIETVYPGWGNSALVGLGGTATLARSDGGGFTIEDFFFAFPDLGRDQYTLRADIYYRDGTVQNSSIGVPAVLNTEPQAAMLIFPTAVVERIELSGLIDENGVYEPGSFYLDNILNLNSVAAIPEPATWSMLIAGFSLAGVAVRTRVKTRARSIPA